MQLKFEVNQIKFIWIMLQVNLKNVVLKKIRLR